MTMLPIAFGLLSGAVLLGMLLAALHLRDTDGRVPPRWIAALHGAAGAAGAAVLMLALRGPARGVAQGVGAFGIVAGALLGFALIVGFAIPLLWRRRGVRPGATMAIHAIAAVSGYVILAAYVLS